MEFRVAVLMVACFSCVVPRVSSVPVVKVAAVGGALGAVKGAIKGAAAAGAGALLVKTVTTALKGALAAKGAFLKSVALKTAAHGVSFGAGAALGAAVVAHKPHHYEHETTYLEHQHVPHVDHGHYYDHPYPVESLQDPIYHEQAHVPSYKPAVYQELPVQQLNHHETYSGSYYR